MADLAFTAGHAHYYSYNNSGNYTFSHDSSGDTWGVLVVMQLTSFTNTITSATYNGVSITANAFDNTATAHYSANVMRVMPFAIASPGVANFNVQWTGGGYLVFWSMSGSGTLDAAVVDASGFSVFEGAPVFTGGVLTPTAFTPTTDRALPILAIDSNYVASTMTANSGCTVAVLGVGGDTTQSMGIFYMPLSTPAGTPTAATINDSNASGYDLTITFAMKPTSGGGGGTNWGPSLLSNSWNRIVQ